MSRCQKCQLRTGNPLDSCAMCLRTLCPACATLGCCGRTPALSAAHYDRQGVPKAQVRDVDEDGDVVDGPTPLMNMDTFYELGGECSNE